MPGLRPSVATPMLDGPYRPNRALDHGATLAECPAPDNLVWQDDHLLFTSGKAVLLLDGLHDHGAEAEEILRFESPVTAMAAAKDGSLAIGLGAAGIAIVGGEHDGRTVARIGDEGSVPTALGFIDPHTLFACMAPPEAGVGPNGTLWRIDLRGARPLCLASGLAGPSGLLLRDLDTVVVSEGGRRRLLACATVTPGLPRVLLDDLPGDPAGLARGSGDTVWLAIPALGPRYSREPYGLVVRLDADCRARASLHGGSEGRSRGVTSCLETRGELIVACRADNVLVAIDLADELER